MFMDEKKIEMKSEIGETLKGTSMMFSSITVPISGRSKEHLKIRGLKAIKLTSLKNAITDAVTNKKPVDINVDSKEPQEILKGTYVANILSKQGYACIAKIIGDIDEIDWTCEPPG